MQEYEFLKKKLEKVVHDYNLLRDSNTRLKMENDFLGKEIENLKNRIFELSAYRKKQKRAAVKLRRILHKIKSL